jgi:hypothetical protein
VSWLKLDDHFPEHQKVTGLHDRAFRFHVTALCYCARNLTDGEVTNRAAGVIAAVLNTRPYRWAKELTEAGLWRATDHGWMINDYLSFNPSATQVKDERNAAAERMRRLRSERTSPERSGERSPARSGTPSRPSGDNQKSLTDTWQPGHSPRNPIASIRQQIERGILVDRIDLEAELAAHPALPQAERIALITLLEARAA